MKNEKSLIVRTGIFAMFVLFSLSSFGQSGEWVARPEADRLVNPLSGNAKAHEKGKKIYEKICWTCHGKSGQGDGPAGKTLDPKPANHTSAAVQSQTDGAIYWKISTGRGEMPAYAKLLSKTERWQLIEYIRTLKEE